MKQKNLLLSVALGLVFANSASAHIVNHNLDGTNSLLAPWPVGGASATDPCAGTAPDGTAWNSNTNHRCVSIAGFTSDGWADGTLVTAGQEVLGDSHRLQLGPKTADGSTQVNVFTFTLAATQNVNITVKENTAIAATDFMDPAISLYSGTLPGNSHDNVVAGTYQDKLVPNAALSGETTPRTYIFQGGRNSAFSTYYGQFNPWGFWSLSDPSGTLRSTLSFKASKHATACYGTIPAAANCNIGGVGTHGRSETLTYNSLPAGTYTIVTSGERCTARPPFASGSCSTGSAFVNGSRFVGSIQLTY